MPEITSSQNFNDLTRCLLGLPVNLAWRGYGTAIFLELGALRDEGGNFQRGEASIGLEFDWRVEKAKSIYFGSGSSQQKIAYGLNSLIGRHIIEIETVGRLPELSIALSNGLWLHSFTIYETQPEWTVFLPDKLCLFSARGKIKFEPYDTTNEL